MSLLGYVLLLTAALCCSSAPAPDGSCPKPPRLKEAALVGDWDDDLYPPNTRVSYQCRPGFIRLGSIKKICANGEWKNESPVGQCRIRSCGHPGDIQFGSFQLIQENSFIFGAIVEYYCDDGYQMVSKERTRQCMASGWSHFPPHCEVKNCPPVEAAPNVNVVSTSYDEEFSVGQVVRFECKEPNLKLDGPPEIFCTSDGEWNLKPPSCVEISCKPPQITNVRVITPSKKIFKNNEVVQITCNEGFILNSNRDITCTKDDWMPNPSCDEVTCNPYQTVKNGRLLPEKSSYKFGQQINVECDDDYVLEHEPNRPRICTSNGWSPPVNCISKICDKPNIKYGHVYNDYYYYYPKRIGSEIDYWCDTNYMPPKKTTWGKSKCTNVGWEPEPKCLRQCALTYAKFENVQLPYRNSAYLEGDTVRFPCKPDYKTPDGKNYVESTCLSDGEFTQATCSRTCPAPELPNGTFQPIKTEFKMGEYLQYECHSGYMTESRTLVGSAQCDGKGWLEPPRCIAVTCEYNRRIYKDGDVVEYRCPHGKRPTSNTGQCYFYGWGPPIDCQDIECTIPETSDLTLIPHRSSYKFGNKVSFSCKEGFDRVGSRESFCKDEGWTPSLPTCQKTPHICRISDMINIIRNPSKNIYKENDEVTVRCEEGFIPKESKITTCTEKDWDPPLPICKEEAPALAPTRPPNENQDQVGVLPVDPEENKKDLDQIPDKPHLDVPPVDQEENKKDLDQIPDKPHLDVPPVVQEENKKDLDQIPDKPHSDVPPVVQDENKKDLDQIPDKPHLDVPPVVQEENKKELTSCRRPPRINNGKMIESYQKTQYVSDDVVKYRCEPGFHFSGTDNIACVNGQWSTQPICTDSVEDSCNAPPDVANATVIKRKIIYNNGERAKYECGNGFHISTEDPASCKRGEWHNVPKCIDQREKCTPAYSLTNMIITDPKEAYYSGDNVTMKCINGFKIYGSPTIRCVKGRWERPPQCIRLIPCRKLPTVTNGEIIESYKKQKYVTDDVVKYLCKSGFHPSGTDSITCVNGQWSAPPTCTEDSCDAPPEVTHETFVKKKTVYNHGENFKYECVKGFSVSREDPASCIKGKWQKVPKCFPSSCKPPPSVENAKISGEPKTSYESGEKVTFSCNYGYSFERSNTGEVECKNKQWTEGPVCRKIGAECGPPPVVQFGDTIKFAKSSYKSSESVEYKCPEYYILQGNKIVRCLNGVWDDAPVCLEPCTAKVSDMDRNNILLKWRDNQKLYSEHGDNITFACKNGYEASTDTDMRRTCNHGKLEYPKCFPRGSCVLQEQTMITNNIQYSLSTFLRNGQTITFQCNEGMTPETKLEAKCEWRNIKYPKCSALQSCKPPEILNGFLTSDQQDSYDSGSNVEFQCNEDHVVGSPISIKCENGQWSDQPICHRPCKLSTEDLNIYNIQLFSSVDPKTFLDVNHRHGKTVNVACKSGFRRPNQAALVTECYDGKFRCPKCFSGKTCRIDQDHLDINNLELDEVRNNDGFYEDGDTIYFKCKNGFQHRGEPTGTCSVETLSYPKCTVESSV